MNDDFLISVSIGLGLTGLAALFWAMRHDQYKDLDGAAARVLNALLTPHLPRTRPMDNWLHTLITATPTEGYNLALKLSRMTIKLTQPDAALRERMRPDYAEDANALIAVSAVVATHFATIAAANDHWREAK